MFPYCLLPADIPHLEINVMVGQTFNVKTLRGRHILDFFFHKAFQDSSFARVVQAQDEQAEGFLALLLHFTQTL